MILSDSGGKIMRPITMERVETTRQDILDIITNYTELEIWRRTY